MYAMGERVYKKVWALAKRERENYKVSGRQNWRGKYIERKREKGMH